MMSSPRIVALVPMRAGSERVKNKNIRLFGGRPLYHHICESLLACPEISEILIDTDCESIQNEAPGLSERIRVIPRPEHLRGGHMPMNEVLLHDVNQATADYFLQTHSTNPLLEASTISRAITTFLAADEHDSLFAVTPLQSRLWFGDGRAVNHDPEVLLRTQDLQPVMEENSNLYIFTKETLVRRKNRIGETPLLFPMNRLAAWDIDTEEDFAIAELLYAYQLEKGAN